MSNHTIDTVKMTFHIFWHETRHWFFSYEKKLAWIGLIALMLMSIFSVYLGVLMNEWSKNFFNAISDKNKEAFLQQVIIFIPLAMLVISDFCVRSYFSSWYAFRWRRWQTETLQARWLAQKNYYRMPLKHDTIDNPDQRIANDLPQITRGIIGLFQQFFREGINFFTFSVLLWGLSNSIPMAAFGISMTIPGFLVWVALAYAFFGVIIVFKVGHPLIDLNRAQEKCEADFRYGLMRIFERREEIATLSGEETEESHLKTVFKVLTHNYYQILKQSIYVNLFQNFYGNVQLFIPLFIIGPAYFAGSITLGVLMQARGMFSQISDSLLSIVDSYQNIASLIASMQRIILFKERMEKLPEIIGDNAPPPIISTSIVIKDLTLLAPNGQKIWLVPDFTVKAGEHKLLMAPSGRGKTSLLRVLSGLSHFYTGTPPAIPSPMMFVPQRPYMPIGTLRGCLAYPGLNAPDERLIPLMKICYLDHLIPFLDTVRDYQQTLSVGEQQRINFLRVLYHRPTWLMMDEPTSNLNQDYAEKLCEQLKTQLPQTGILIITHSQLPHFDEIIRDKAQFDPSPDLEVALT
jgi:putative ATP-binding cassette transporter